MKPAASLGAVLELLRALNWMIRADVPWPTKRGQSFDFVLVGEPGVFAMWVYDGEPEGIEEAAAGLSALMGDVRVRPVVCRGFAALGNAHPEVLYCTPETALDLLIGLPPHDNQPAIRAIATNLRDLEVPIPPEPEPEPEPVTAPEPEPAPEPPRLVAPEPVRVQAPRPVAVTPKPVVVPSSPAPSPAPTHPAEPSVVAPEPSVVAPRPAAAVAKVSPAPKSAPVVDKPAALVAPKPVVKKTPSPEVAAPKLTPPPAATPIATPQPAPAVSTPPPPVVEAPPTPVVEAPEPAPKPERQPAGRHRSERPRFARRTPPPPPADRRKEALPKSTLELPTALAPVPSRIRGGNAAAERFDNNYVYVPEPVSGPGPLKREFRAKPFLTGIVAIIALVVVAGLGVKAWPQLVGLIKSDANPSAAFGQAITTGSTNFHPKLTLSVTVPHRVATSRGLDAYAVDLSVSNVGTASWALPPRTAFVMVDSLGESHALTSISGVASSRWSGSLKPTQSWAGRLVFELKSGRTPLRLRFALANNGSDTATWHN